MKIQSIKLTTKKGKEIELSIDEAKELHEQFNELFGKQTEYIPSSPVVIEKYKERNPWKAPIWCETTGIGGGSSNGMLICKGDSGLTATYMA